MNNLFWPSGTANRSDESGRLVADFARLGSCVVVGAALCWYSIDATAKGSTLTIAAPEVRVTKVRLAELEKTFWLCDHAATRHGVDPELGQLCFNVTEDLKKEKFGGDAERMLAWWQRNKEAQHQKLDQSEGLR